MFVMTPVHSDLTITIKQSEDGIYVDVTTMEHGEPKPYPPVGPFQHLEDAVGAAELALHVAGVTGHTVLLHAIWVEHDEVRDMLSRVFLLYPDVVVNRDEYFVKAVH